MKIHLNLAAFILTLISPTVHADEHTTVPLGGIKPTVPASADVTFAIAIDRNPVYEGTIESVSGNVVTVTGAAYTADEFGYQSGIQSNTYYVNITSGNSFGIRLKITDNSSLNPDGRKNVRNQP